MLVSCAVPPAKHRQPEPINKPKPTSPLMKTLLSITAAVIAAGSAFAAPVNSTCIMSGKPVKEGVTSEYKGKTVGFCCNNCKARFDSNPDKFGKKIAK